MGQAGEGGALVWEIGRADGGNAEFALAPSGYGQYREDGFFVVGRSEARRDWPYVHPGPADGWAGGRSHTFTVAFALEDGSWEGESVLRVRLVDTHAGAPPELRVTVNGREFRRGLPAGAGDASVFGDPSRGRAHGLEVVFPSSLLRAGANEVTLTTVSGSWLLYDWLGLEVPGGARLGAMSGTVVGAIESLPVLVEREGRLEQTVRVAVRNMGEAAEGRLTVEGAAPVVVAMPEGAAHFEVSVPAVEAERSVGVRVEVGGKEVASRRVTLRPVRRWVVYLLPHSHVDIGYTHVQTEVEEAQWKYLEMAMEAARASAHHPAGSRFKWNVEVLWAVDSYLRQATPEKREAFFEAVRAGQVGLQALYGNQLTGLCRPQELMRLMGFAQELGRRAGVPVESAMITDVPGYTWGMVPALVHSGVRYFSIGPNGGDRIGNTAKAWGDKPFWWVGPNERDRVLVWMTGTGYYRVFSSPENLLSYLGQLEAKGYAYDYVQVRHCLGDNGAPDVGFADTVRQWNERYAYPKLVIATTEEMFRDFERRYGDRIPTARGDFTPYWEDGAGSSARETAMNRASADRLVQAEALWARFRPEAYPAEAFYQAWRDVLLYDEHTWGAHNSISEPDHPFVKSQWAIKQAFALEGDRQSRALLAGADEGRGDLVGAAGLEVIDVMNTTGHSLANTLVVVPPEWSRAGDAVGTSATNLSAAATQRLSTGELIFRPCLGGQMQARYYIGSGGGRRGSLEGGGVMAEGMELRSEKVTGRRGVVLRVDPTTGGIASLVVDGRELVDQKAGFGLNEYFYLPGSDVAGVRRSGPVRVAVKERGPLLASLVVEGEAPGCHRLTREYRLHAMRGYVEVVDTVDKQAVRAKEGVHFGFPFDVPGGVVRMDVPWGVVRPEEDQLVGACRNWFTVQRWVDISNEGMGVTLLTPDAPLVQVGAMTANLIGGLAGSKLWLERIEPSGTIYSWAMNNHWHTNYRAEQEGPTVFRYVIVPHEGGAADQVSMRAQRVAMELSQPPVVMRARGDLGRGQPFQVVGGSGSGAVQVAGFKPSEDGRAWILRLFGYSGEDEVVTVTWGEPKPVRVWLSDNSERPGREVQGKVEVPAWGLVTLRAERP